MKRILIVDDRDDNLYLLRALLEGHHYEVEQARNGSEALHKAQANTPDMIISDILMPEMDGFTFCRILKKDERLKHVPFIFYTATYTDPKDERLALDMGANAFLIKSMEPDEFLRRIEEVLAAVKDGKLSAQQEQTTGAEVILKEYNEVLIRKLEHKMLKLEQANKALEAEIAARKQVEAALRDSEERYRSLFENSLDGVLLTAPDGNILEANPAACRIFARSEDEICKMDRAVLVDVSDPRLSKAIDERTRTGRFSGELTFLRKDGTRFPGEISSVIFKDAKGKLKTSMIIRDITERKRAEDGLRASEKRLREAQEMAHLGHWHWDVKTGKVDWSDEVYKIFCLDPKTFRPHIDSILALSPWPEEHRRDQELIRQAIESHSPGSYEQKFLRPDKSIGYYLSSFQGNYADNGDLIAIVGTVMDITERKQAESQREAALAEIRKLNEDLEQRISERTAELKKTIIQLEELNRVFVGRELKMAELKKRIAELEKS
jgi:PAS domain S-box-containing protein